jgi:hypothetical protein
MFSHSHTGIWKNNLLRRCKFVIVFFQIPVWLWPNICDFYIYFLLFLYLVLKIKKKIKFLTSKYFNDFNWHCNLEYLVNYIFDLKMEVLISETCRRFNWLPSKNN